MNGLYFTGGGGLVNSRRNLTLVMYSISVFLLLRK